MKGVPVADWRFTRRDDGFSSRKKKPTVSLAGQTAGFCTDYEMNFIKFTLGMQGKMSTKGADKAGLIMGIAIAVAIVLIAVSVVLWRIAPNGFY